jgi:chitin synthase
VTLWVYAVLAAYLIVCSVILSIEAFKDVLGIEGSIGDKLMNMFKQTNGVLIAAVMSTIGELSEDDSISVKLIHRNISARFVALCKVFVSKTSLRLARPMAYVQFFPSVHGELNPPPRSQADPQLLAPSFTNVLNVYAFCNLHDVSWGQS